MGSFGTGLPPGAHGLVGMQVLDPQSDETVNELSGRTADPRSWQPYDTVFEAAVNAGVEVTMVGPRYFEGRADHRGARAPVSRRHACSSERVTAAVAARCGPRREPSCTSTGGTSTRSVTSTAASPGSGGDEVESVDGALASLVGQVPDDTLVVVTADHGMVDIPHEYWTSSTSRTSWPECGTRAASRAASSSTRSRVPPRTSQVWRERVGDRARVLPREQVIAEGWFGPVEERVAGRIGDIVVAMNDSFAVVHSGLMRPELVRLLGLHGSTSDVGSPCR